MKKTASAANMSVSREARGVVNAAGLRMAWGYWPGRGLPVVGLHGITASYCNFVGVAQMLAGRRPLVAFDLRGRGDTDKPEGPYGMETHADDVTAALAEFGLGPSIVVGHSMGAYVAAAMGARHPETVAGLVLVDGGLPLSLPEGIAAEDLLDVVLTAQVARLRKTFSSEEEYMNFWRALLPFSGDRWNSWVEAYLRYDLAGSDGSLRPKASETAVRQDSADNFDAGATRARLGALDVPVLMIRATEGFNPGDPPLFPNDLVERESQPIGRFEDRVVEGTTHYTIALGEHGAATVADAIVDFAERCGR